MVTTPSASRWIVTGAERPGSDCVAVERRQAARASPPTAANTASSSSPSNPSRDPDHPAPHADPLRAARVSAAAFDTPPRAARSRLRSATNPGRPGCRGARARRCSNRGSNSSRTSASRTEKGGPCFSCSGYSSVTISPTQPRGNWRIHLARVAATQPRRQRNDRGAVEERRCIRRGPAHRARTHRRKATRWARNARAHPSASARRPHPTLARRKTARPRAATSSTPNTRCPCSASHGMSTDLPASGTNTVEPSGAPTRSQHSTSNGDGESWWNPIRPSRQRDSQFSRSRSSSSLIPRPGRRPSANRAATTRRATHAHRRNRPVP